MPSLENIVPFDSKDATMCLLGGEQRLQALALAAFNEREYQKILVRRPSC
jgi:hypothetical protein